MTKILLLISLLFSSIGISQTTVDEFISVHFPSNPSIRDTIIEGFKFETIYLNNVSDSYMAMFYKIDTEKNVLSNLPDNEKNLNEYYKGVVRGQTKRMNESGYSLKESSGFNLDGLKAYQANYIDSETKMNKAKFVHLVLEEYTYTFGYISHFDFDYEGSSDFFESITVDKTNSPTQYKGNSSSYKFGYITGKILVYGGFIALILWLIFRKKKNKG